VPNTAAPHGLALQGSLFVAAAVWVRSFGAGFSVPPSALWNERGTIGAGRMRCAAVSAGAFCSGSFVERLASFEVGVARMRAVSQCQVTWMPSRHGSSPSNHCLERAVICLWWCAASAGRKYALASHWTRFWAAAQARR
jgi:hypothetical protein